MIPQIQSRVGDRGRCFPACIASILEMKEWEVPDLSNVDVAQVDRYLTQHGLYYREVSTEVPPLGYHIILGISPRGGYHAVVGRDGEFVFDPHPRDGTGRGLVEVTGYGLLIKKV